MEGKYYADGEDAYEMRKHFGPQAPPGMKKSASRTKKEKEQAANAAAAAADDH